jgi:hypothetical protein
VTIKAIPTGYRGITFASSLEADWAATFDFYGWTWQYEPVGVQLEDGQWYRPDFYLPTQRVWAEVKGPHNERIDKPTVLQSSLPGDAFEWDADLVVILRPPQAGWGGAGETMIWADVEEAQDIVIVRCPECLHYGFMDMNGIWSCRRHMRVRPEPNKFWTEPEGDLFRPGELPFTRAPRGRRETQRLNEFFNESGAA